MGWGGSASVKGVVGSGKLYLVCVCVVWALQQEIRVLEARRDSLKSHANLSAIAEYRKKEAEYKVRLGELETVSSERDVAR